MHCAEVKYYLSDYSRGILLDEVRTEIHEHLNDCKVCAKVFRYKLTESSTHLTKSKCVDLGNYYYYKRIYRCLQLI